MQLNIYFTICNFQKSFSTDESTSDLEIGQKISSSYKFAITGKSWAVIKEHVPDIIPRIAVKGAVFARMSSDQKQQLIQELQQIGYYVGKKLSNVYVCPKRPPLF